MGHTEFMFWYDACFLCFAIYMNIYTAFEGTPIFAIGYGPLIAFFGASVSRDITALKEEGT